MLTGITIGGGFKPGTGDPPYDYIFKIYLDPGSTFGKNDFITIDSLVGVKPSSLSKEPENSPKVVWGAPTIRLENSTAPYASDVTWTFSGTKTYANPAGSGKELYLGTFEVQTAVNFNKKHPFPVSSGTIIDFTFGHGKKTDGSGTITLSNLTAPEPASSTIVLLTGGTAALGGLVVRTRRRWKARG